MDKLQYALQWASRGFPVFPLTAGTRVPLKDSRGHKEATTDAEQIKAWWTDAETGEILNHNIGCRTPPGYVIVDLDVKDGRNGVGEYLALGGELGGLMVRTGSGGYHVYCEGPETANTIGTLAPGIDTRGPDGYGVAPGSVVKGGVYEVVADDKPLPLPTAIASRLPPRTERVERPRLYNVEDDKPANIERFIEVCRRVEPAFGGSWHDLSRNLACDAVRLAVSCDTATQIMLDYWVPRGVGFYEDNRNEKWPADVAGSYAWALTQGEHGMHATGEPVDIFAGVQVSFLEEEPCAPKILLSRTWAEGNAKRAEPVPYLIKGLVGPGDQMAVLGGPGCGKSVLLPYLAFCTATGTPFLGRKVKQARTLYFAAENGEGLERRLQVLGDRMGDPGDWLRVFPLPINLSKDSEDCETFANTLNYYQPGLIIIDTVFAGFPETDLTDRGPTGIQWVVNAARAFANRQPKPVVAFGHHTPKTGETAYGGQQIQAMFDTTLYVEGVLKEDRSVTIRKNRMGPDGDTYSFKIASAPVSVDEEGDTITAPIIEWIETRTEEEMQRAQNASWLAEVTTGARNVLDVLKQATDRAVKNGAGSHPAEVICGAPLARIEREALAADLVSFGLVDETASPAVRARVTDHYLKDLKKHGFVDYDSGHVWIPPES